MTREVGQREAIPLGTAPAEAAPLATADTGGDLTISRGERIFRGMLGMGMAYAAVATVIMILLSAVALVATIRGEATDFTEDLDFMVVAAVGWPVIAFLLGMIYAGVLAVVARGRSFREVSVARVGLAGVAIGLIPNIVVAVGSWLGPGTLSRAEVLDPLFIFPPISAMVAIATLLIARRAKTQV
jgi:hypothetical protein